MRTALYWQQWLKVAEASGIEPKPTGLHEEFVKASLARSCKQKKRHRLLVVGLIAVLAAGLVASVTLYMHAGMQRDKAREAEGRALDAEAAARQEAHSNFLLSVGVLANSIISALDLRTGNLGNGDHDTSLWDLKLIYAVIARLTRPELPAVNSRALNAALELLQRQVHISHSVSSLPFSPTSVATSPFAQCFALGKDTSAVLVTPMPYANDPVHLNSSLVSADAPQLIFSM